MMNKQKLMMAIAIPAALVGTLASIHFAVASAKRNDPLVGAKGAGGVDAPNVRIAAVISPPQSNFLVRSKGVNKVTRPSKGTYCIKPASSSINVSKVVPVVAVDYSNSTNDSFNNMVQYRSSPSGTGCPSNTIAVNTVTLSGFSYTLSNAVGFTIVVP